jgi:hypothetical protein
VESLTVLHQVWRSSNDSAGYRKRILSTVRMHDWGLNGTRPVIESFSFALPLTAHRRRAVLDES